MPSVLDHVRVDADVAEGGWRVDAGGRSYTVGEWTWGQRRRLLAACVRPGVGLDEAAFVDGVVGLLVDPAPPPAERGLLAAVALRLCGVEPGQQVRPLLDAEALLAHAYGWGPAELDRQPAPRIDEHVSRLPDPAAPIAGGDWTSIVVSDDGS